MHSLYKIDFILYYYNTIITNTKMNTKDVKMEIDDDYGHYCDLENEYPSQMATKVYRTNHHYVVTNHYAIHNDPEYYYDTDDYQDVSKFIKGHKEQAYTRMLTRCIDFSVFCIFVGTVVFCLYRL